MPVLNFYIPNVDFWKWELISEQFVKLQLARARESYVQIDGAIRLLDVDRANVEREIRSVWAVANVQHMRAYQSRFKEIAKERKRLHYLRMKLETVINRMLSEGKKYRWTL